MDGRKNNAISIEKRVAGTSRRYVGRIDGVAGEAELHFTVRGQRRSAPTGMRGTGAAMALIEHVIGDARANGFKITSLCPYVLAQYRKLPEWNDVMTGAPSTP